MAPLNQFARQHLIGAAVGLAPEQARADARWALAGDQAAARRLARSLADRRLAPMASAMYRLATPASALREVLQTALSRPASRQAVFKLARGRTGLVRWLSAGGFGPPAGDPDEPVAIYRGANGCAPETAASRPVWTLSLDAAAWAASAGGDVSRAFVVQASVPRGRLFLLAEDGVEQEVVPDGVPGEWVTIVDAAVIAAARDRHEVARLAAAAALEELPRTHA